MIEHQSETPPRNKGGRPSKGLRVKVRIDVPVSLAQRLEEDARAFGTTRTDRLNAILRDYYGMQNREGLGA